VASEASPQEVGLVHGADREGDRLLGGVLGRGDHREAAHPRRLESLPLGGATIPPTMSPIDGASKYWRVGRKSCIEWFLEGESRSLGPILSLSDSKSRNILLHFLLIKRPSRAEHRSNEVVIEGEFSKLPL
jgi:hypothetical protein